MVHSVVVQIDRHGPIWKDKCRRSNTREMYYSCMVE